MKLGTLLATALVAVSANANSLGDMSRGSSKAIGGLLGLSGKTISVVVDSVVSSAQLVGEGLEGSGRTLVFIVEHPSEASKKSGQAMHNASQWVVTSTGNVLKLSWEGSKAFVQDPSGSISKGYEDSKGMIQVVWDSSGVVSTASGEALKDIYGEDVELVTNGSGEVFTTSTASSVVSYEKTRDGSSTVVRFIDEHSVDSTLQLSGDLSTSVGEALKTLFVEMPSNAFDASVKAGRQNDVQN